jgi:rare lipoprotein A
MMRAGLLAMAAAAVCAACSTGTDRDGAPGRHQDLSKIPDAVPSAEPRSTRGNPPFYEVYGRRYHVMDSSEGYVERGVASWYGTKFHGRLTSNGEVYDMYAMTAAHKTLPLPAYAEVTNLENGKRVTVRINDRGPFVKDRIIDLSYAAATRIDMTDKGTALVEVRVIPPGRHSTSAPAGRLSDVYVQAGAFSSEDNALGLASRITGAGIGPVTLRSDKVDGRHLYRVRVGPLADSAEFDTTVARLRDIGIADPHLALD